MFTARFAKKMLADAALKGLTTAFDTYYRWSGGWGLSYAPESFIQAEVARSLFSIIPYVTLEAPTDLLLDRCEIDKLNIPDTLRKGRVDIVGWKRFKPIILVEAKRAWGHIEIREDAKRIRDLIALCLHTIQHGMMVVYSDAASEEALLARYDGLAASANCELVARTPTSSIHKGSAESWLWSGYCYWI